MGVGLKPYSWSHRCLTEVKNNFKKRGERLSPCSSRPSLRLPTSHPCWFLPTVEAVIALGRMLQHHRLPDWTLHHVQRPVPRVRVPRQVPIHLRVRPQRSEVNAGGLQGVRIGLCDLLLHQTLRCSGVSTTSSSSSRLTVHTPLRQAVSTV